MTNNSFVENNSRPETSEYNTRDLNRTVVIGNNGSSRNTIDGRNALDIRDRNQEIKSRYLNSQSSGNMQKPYNLQQITPAQVVNN